MRFPSLRALRGNRLTERLAQLIGSQTVEDYHWNSGWTTALLQCLVGLRAGERLLDIGCGSGRLARGLDGWFGEGYVGVDVNAELVEYCRKAFPAFRFEHIDLASDLYNPESETPAEAVVLDFPDASFDCITLFSVVTHITTPVTRAYLGEIERLLAPGGSGVFTCFLIDDDVRDDPATGGAFCHSTAPGCYHRNPDVVSEAIAYEDELMRELIAEAGLRVAYRESGSWRGRPGLGFQDLVVVERRDAADVGDGADAGLTARATRNVTEDRPE